jgi:hypothetical protein
MDTGKKLPRLGNALGNSVMTKYFKPRSTQLHTFDFPQKVSNLLSKLRDSLEDTRNTIVFANKKPEPRCGALSKTRSAFIGVTKNGSNWQALIAIKKKKTYIGTYVTETEAAIAFDFYCILIHGLTAKTNFSYTKGQLFEMISNYMENDSVLIPKTLGSVFLNQLH